MNPTTAEKVQEPLTHLSESIWWGKKSQPSNIQRRNEPRPASLSTFWLSHYVGGVKNRIYPRCK